jgi:4-coumarate--CoA ligase
MIIHPNFIDTVLSAAHVAGLLSDRMILFDPVPNNKFPNFSTVRELIMDGLSWEPTFIERTLQPGEGKTKLALLCFSSGTTGKPKVRPSSNIDVVPLPTSMA